LIVENEILDDPLNWDIRSEELNRAIRMIRKKSSPGKDGIDYETIRNFPEQIKTIYLRILNKIWTKVDIPKAWKTYQVVFINKANKEKVRPIALSSCLGKIMERIINERMSWWAESNNILDTNQNGFRRERLCGDNLLKITTDIKVQSAKEEYTLAAFLDVSSAYDNVNYTIMI